jgi:hypothetical protein
VTPAAARRLTTDGRWRQSHHQGDTPGFIDNRRSSSKRNRAQERVREQKRGTFEPLVWERAVRRVTSSGPRASAGASRRPLQIRAV